MSHNGETVSAFERELASYCGAKYAIAAANGTVTLQAALVAIGMEAGDCVAVPPLTMAASTIAILNVGAVPLFVDVDERTWLMRMDGLATDVDVHGELPVSLYGLHAPHWGQRVVDDAAQTLRPHGTAAFTSLSFQASKVLALGEGGALLTNDEELASRARSHLSLGYRMAPTQARIDSAALKSPTFDRHHTWPAINGRMNDLTAAEGLKYFRERPMGGKTNVRTVELDWAKNVRLDCAQEYRHAIEGCEWLTPQHVPDGWRHDYWTYAVACDTPKRAIALADAVAKHGGERPYPAWRLTYQEPAFRHLNPHCAGTFANRSEPGIYVGDIRKVDGSLCPVAEDLQPRILQLQTNSVASAERNAGALKKAIEELS